MFTRSVSLGDTFYIIALFVWMPAAFNYIIAMIKLINEFFNLNMSEILSFATLFLIFNLILAKTPPN
jgi:hypothetical protein